MIGIYKITNKINAKWYIGQSNDIERRWREHKNCGINKSKNTEYPLYRAIRKYGIDNFEFEILEECHLEELLKLEQRYYDHFISGRNTYNQCYPNISPTTGVPRSEAVRKILREKGQLRVGKLSPNYGRKWSPEVKQRQRKAKLGKVTSEETKLKIRNSLKGTRTGVKNTMAKLTDEAVYSIRISKIRGLSYMSVYVKYNYISKATFNDVWVGKSWKHIVVVGDDL